MLSNGTTLGYKAGEGSTYTILKDLKEIPDIGVDPEMIENTRLGAKIKTFEPGIGEAGDLVFKFVYENATADSEYRVMRALAEAGDTVDYQMTYPDGFAVEFSAIPSIKLISAGGLNTPVEWDMTCALQSDFDYTDPAIGGG